MSGNAPEAPDSTERLKFVDAHVHFWDLSLAAHPWLCREPPIPFRYGHYGAIRRNYLPEDFIADAGQYRPLRAVYVETEWEPGDPLGETRWVAELREKSARKFGNVGPGRPALPEVMVAQAWLDREDVAEVLAAQAAHAFVRGVRHKPAAAAAPDKIVGGAPGSMGNEKWRGGFSLLADHGLSFDLQTPCWHLHEAAELARDFPGTSIVLNHTGLPADRSREGLALWRRGMDMLAANPNTAVKISGLGLPGRPWTVADNRRVVLDAIAIFGVERCMFAGNFPVDSLVATYPTIMGGFQEIVRKFSPEHQQLLFHDNAVRIYRLET